MPRRAKPKTQAPKAATGQPYGAAGQQLAAQEAVPLPDNTALPQPARPAPAPMVAPGALGAFNRPTERPGEPITAGAPIGAGPGPEILPFEDDDAEIVAAAMYRANPTEELRGILEELQTRRGQI